MAHRNDTSPRDFGNLLINGSSSEYTDEHISALHARAEAYRQFFETFPVLITNNVFNIIYISGIIANFVLLLYLIFYKRYKTPVFCVIFSLGISDLGVCTGAALSNTLLFPLIQGPLWLCKVIVVVLFLSYIVSNYHIALFAVLRFQGICIDVTTTGWRTWLRLARIRPAITSPTTFIVCYCTLSINFILRFMQLVYPLTSHSKVTTVLLFKICLAIWITHSIQAFTVAGYYVAIDLLATDGSAAHGCSFTGNEYSFYLFIILVWFLLPFVTTSGFHVAKQMIIVLSQSALMTSENERIQQVRKQTDSRALAIVIVTYLITIFPYIVQAIRYYLLNKTFNPLEAFLENVFFQAAFTNSAINPWIYLFASESVRSDVRIMLRCKKINEM